MVAACAAILATIAFLNCHCTHFLVLLQFLERVISKVRIATLPKEADEHHDFHQKSLVNFAYFCQCLDGMKKKLLTFLLSSCKAIVQ